MADRPTGTVTFLFTDLEGSTRLWEEHPDAMRTALKRHDELLVGAVEGHDGYVVKTTGDGVHAAFATAGDAVEAAIAAQLALDTEGWTETGPLRVRMGVHTGSAELRDGDYYGSTVNRAARLMDAAHGGQIVISNATEELVRDDLAPSIHLEDLGEHRLRGLDRPERVFQLHAPGLPSLFPPLRSLVGERTNLPAPTTSFVGRERILADVADALHASRIVTLTGVGGVGKTRLALEAAVRFVPEVPDGCWLIELAPLVDGDALVEVVAAALGVSPPPGESPTTAVRDYLRGKRLLLVLDNCEHLLDPIARYVDELLVSSPGVAVLATSREGLGIAGEHILAVPSLVLPTEDDDLAADAEAVQLFAARAAEAKAGFALSPDNSPAVCRLVRRLDGIPLAIELAAARVRALTPAELADRVDERFRLLAGGRRTAVERHQTLRRAIDWSYDLLAPSEQVALQRSAVFAGGFPVTAAEAVIAGDDIDEIDVLDLLGRLVDKSLVVAEDHDGRTRYRLLETIRTYAYEHLEATAEAEHVLRRHAEHYVTFANEADVGLRGPDEAEWSAHVSVELDNLRAAVAWAVADGDADLALRIVAPLAVQGTSVGYSASAWSETVLGMDGADAHPLYAEVLAWSGWAAVIAGEFERGERLARRVLELVDTTPRSERSRCAVLWPCMGVTAYVGDAETTYQLAQQLQALARSIDDDHYLANSYTFTAIAFTLMGDPARGREANDQALALARRIGNPSAIAYAAMTGGVGSTADDQERARALFDESIGASMSVGNQVALSIAVASSAFLDVTTGQLENAARTLLRATDYADRVSSSSALRVSCIPAAVALLATGGDDEATAVLSAAAPPSAGATGAATAEIFAQAVDVVRARLGDERFATCATRGRALTDDEARALLREQLETFLAARSTTEA